MLWRMKNLNTHQPYLMRRDGQDLTARPCHKATKGAAIPKPLSLPVRT
jgi:hypothetical protein